MDSEAIVKDWFQKWQRGDYLNLPVAETFKHTSPFGTIDGRKEYLDLIRNNEDKFLGYSFDIHDGLYESERACVRYTARQGKHFTLDVSEWYYLKEDLIEEIVSYYHIGEIRQERKLNNPD